MATKSTLNLLLTCTRLVQPENCAETIGSRAQKNRISCSIPRMAGSDNVLKVSEQQLHSSTSAIQHRASKTIIIPTIIPSITTIINRQIIRNKHILTRETRRESLRAKNRLVRNLRRRLILQELIITESRLVRRD